MMDWEYELTYPPRRGFTRVAVQSGGKTYTSYKPLTLGDVFIGADPFHFPPLTYYWEDGALALLPSAEQYAIRKRNAPSD